jgi:hypothetical protein
MKLSVNKFIKARRKSTERSKKGELELLETDIFRGRIDMLYNEMHPLAGRANECEHKLLVGCKLPLIKRTKKECECCL